MNRYFDKYTVAQGNSIIVISRVGKMQDSECSPCVSRRDISITRTGIIKFLNFLLANCHKSSRRLLAGVLFEAGSPKGGQKEAAGPPWHRVECESVGSS